MSDPLDDLLDRSAPLLTDRGAGGDAALTQMIQDARDTVRPLKRSRRRVAVLSGGLALLLVGGAGMATAADLLPWTQEQREPYVAVEYQLPSGLNCEQRLFILDTDDPAAGRWLRDFAAENDLLALSDVDGYLERMAGWEQPQPTGDAAYWSAVGGSLWETVLSEADEAGFAPGSLSGEQSQTYCTDATGDVVFPG